jgi:hypothetical protein
VHVPGKSAIGFRGHRSTYRALSVLLAIATGGTFATERFLLETQVASLGELPAVVMGGVVLAVAGGAFHVAMRGHGIDVGLVVTGGPVAGLAVYLIAYHLVLPPSNDSPTSLVFLGFAGSVIGIGVVGYVAGRLYNRST